jgi:hypothetical protein
MNPSVAPPGPAAFSQSPNTITHPEPTTAPNANVKKPLRPIARRSVPVEIAIGVIARTLNACTHAEVAGARRQRQYPKKLACLRLVCARFGPLVAAFLKNVLTSHACFARSVGRQFSAMFWRRFAQPRTGGYFAHAPARHCLALTASFRNKRKRNLTILSTVPSQHAMAVAGDANGVVR